MYESSMASYRAMQSPFLKPELNRIPAAAATRTPFGTAARPDEAGAKRASRRFACIEASFQGISTGIMFALYKTSSRMRMAHVFIRPVAFSIYD